MTLLGRNVPGTLVEVRARAGLSLRDSKPVSGGVSREEEAMSTNMGDGTRLEDRDREKVRHLLQDLRSHEVRDAPPAAERLCVGDFEILYRIGTGAMGRYSLRGRLRSAAWSHSSSSPEESPIDRT